MEKSRKPKRDIFEPNESANERENNHKRVYKDEHSPFGNRGSRNKFN